MKKIFDDKLLEKQTSGCVLNVSYVLRAVEALRFNECKNLNDDIRLLKDPIEEAIIYQIRQAKKMNLKIINIGIPKKYQEYLMNKMKLEYKDKCIYSLFGIRVKKSRVLQITTEISLFKPIAI